ncbi:MAG TPA: hypothetical protein VM802_06840 [Chitinophaga sp.]|uniref:hypothetical protein n=1 Tax=Chitinophaga sp. TaxID=1869181 RepID=UPI002C39B19C|nr:hypothetical protein [Chitinophaga sp.]HVI44566.1 hypothetical protein [Chitinophaga sp.]
MKKAMLVTATFTMRVIVPKSASIAEIIPAAYARLMQSLPPEHTDLVLEISEHPQAPSDSEEISLDI